VTVDFHPLRLADRLTDGVIVLDPHTLADAEAHWAGEDAEMMRRFDALRRATLDEIKGAMQRWIDFRAAGGPQYPYAMRDLSGVLMGGAELQRRTADCCHVSYWTYPDFRGHGYAARTLALLCAAAAGAAGSSTSDPRGYSDRAMWNPLLSSRSVGLFLSRLDERRLCGTLRQEPPRTTR
jgi:RimJ/RimL family protein N-acetyltransferase